MLSSRWTRFKYFIPVPPELSGPSGRHYVMENSPVPKEFLYKEVLGLPPPHAFTWLLNRDIFPGNDRVKLQDNGRTLEVAFPLRVDSGNYTLTVVSGSGSASLQLDLILTCV